jgi:hypothetical protein
MIDKREADFNDSFQNITGCMLSMGLFTPILTTHLAATMLGWAMNGVMLLPKE